MTLAPRSATRHDLRAGVVLTAVSAALLRSGASHKAPPLKRGFFLCCVDGIAYSRGAASETAEIPVRESGHAVPMADRHAQGPARSGLNLWKTAVSEKTRTATAVRRGQSAHAQRHPVRVVRTTKAHLFSFCVLQGLVSFFSFRRRQKAHDNTRAGSNKMLDVRRHTPHTASGGNMLTFTTAPKTLLGPCTHALWNGKTIWARHHSHMPDGEAQWKADVAKVFAQPRAAEIADRINLANGVLAGLSKKDQRDEGNRADFQMAMLSLTQDQDALKRLAITAGVGGVFG